MFGRNWLETKEDKWNDFESEAMPHLPYLFRVAVWLTKNRTEAEDLVQETTMQALKSFQNYQVGTNCRAWLIKIMYNLNAKRLHKLGRIQLVDEPEEVLAETIPFEPQIPQTLTDEDVIAALERMPENSRSIIVLADLEEFSYKEISSILGIPIGTVMSRLSRGRKVLRMELTDYARNCGFTGQKEAVNKGEF